MDEIARSKSRIASDLKTRDSWPQIPLQFEIAIRNARLAICSSTIRYVKSAKRATIRVCDRKSLVIGDWHLSHLRSFSSLLAYSEDLQRNFGEDLWDTIKNLPANTPVWENPLGFQRRTKITRKRGHTRKRRNFTVLKTCVFGCVAFSGALCFPIKGRQTHTRKRKHTRYRRFWERPLCFRVCCVFGCVLASAKVSLLQKLWIPTFCGAPKKNHANFPALELRKACQRTELIHPSELRNNQESYWARYVPEDVCSTNSLVGIFSSLIFSLT